jgi:hypothetical protein
MRITDRDRWSVTDCRPVTDRSPILVWTVWDSYPPYHRRVAVEVETSIDIECPRSVDAAYVSNPDNATDWYVNIESVDWKTPRPAVVGSHVAFVANFLGRRIAYTYEVRDIVPDERFVMSHRRRTLPHADHLCVARRPSRRHHHDATK